jgi:hypothetical protein
MLLPHLARGEPRGAEMDRRFGESRNGDDTREDEAGEMDAGRPSIVKPGQVAGCVCQEVWPETRGQTAFPPATQWRFNQRHFGNVSVPLSPWPADCTLPLRSAGNRMQPAVPSQDRSMQRPSGLCQPFTPVPSSTSLYPAQFIDRIVIYHQRQVCVEVKRIPVYLLLRNCAERKGMHS